MRSATPITVLNAPADVCALFAPIAHLPNEVAALAYLDPKWSILGLRHIAGGMDHVPLSIRDIARDALSLDARALILAHNHPGGDATPSEADRATTRRLAMALTALEIEMVDHVILAGDAVTSFRALGWL